MNGLFLFVYDIHTPICRYTTSQGISMNSSAFGYVLFANDQGKYYKKQINTKQFSLTDVAELLKLIKAACTAEAERCMGSLSSWAGLDEISHYSEGFKAFRTNSEC